METKKKESAKKEKESAKKGENPKDRTKSGKIMSLVGEINSVLDEIPQMEEQINRLVGVISQVGGSVDELKEVQKKKEIESRNREKLIKSLKAFIAIEDTLDAYIRALEQAEPSDTIGVIQTCSLIANFLRENRDNPLAKMEAYRERFERVQQLGGEVCGKVLGSVNSIFAEFDA